jgi:hypothetical protein
MTAPNKSNRVYVALCVNAAILLLILVALVSRGGRLLADTPASAHGLTVMPGQLSPQVWGCYVVDNDSQTLSVYSYYPGDHQLRLAASRDVQYDRRLGDYNTSPSPSEIKEMAERLQEPPRAATLPQASSPEIKP